VLRLPNLDILNLDLGQFLLHDMEIRFKVGVNGHERMLTPLKYLTLPSNLSGGPCCPTLDFVFALGILNTFDRLTLLLYM
jgi:hypothetical protein